MPAGRTGPQGPASILPPGGPASQEALGWTVLPELPSLLGLRSLPRPLGGPPSVHHTAPSPAFLPARGLAGAPHLTPRVPHWARPGGTGRMRSQQTACGPAAEEGAGGRPAGAADLCTGRGPGPLAARKLGQHWLRSGPCGKGGDAVSRWPQASGAWAAGDLAPLGLGGCAPRGAACLPPSRLLRPELTGPVSQGQDGARRGPQPSRARGPAKGRHVSAQRPRSGARSPGAAWLLGRSAREARAPPGGCYGIQGGQR